MRAYDFSPLYRATVGFDRVADLMDRVLTADVGQSTYPPYNIEKTGDESYRISVAVAGFGDDDLNVEQRENLLVVSASKSNTPHDTTYLHRGIATRSFEKRFHLADHVRVSGATNVNGMLNIELVREVPEALKPRQIQIEKPAALKKKRAKAIAAETVEA